MSSLVIQSCLNEEDVLTKTDNRLFTYFENLIKPGVISNDSHTCVVDNVTIYKTCNIKYNFYSFASYSKSIMRFLSGIVIFFG